MRYAARTDASHTDMVDRLREYGYSVKSLAGVGKGFPDLVVARQGINLLVEVKTQGAANRRRRTGGDAERLRKQAEFRATWQGPVIEAETPEQVLAWFMEASRAR